MMVHSSHMMMHHNTYSLTQWDSGKNGKVYSYAIFMTFPGAGMFPPVSGSFLDICSS